MIGTYKNGNEVYLTQFIYLIFISATVVNLFYFKHICDISSHFVCDKPTFLQSLFRSYLPFLPVFSAVFICINAVESEQYRSCNAIIFIQKSDVSDAQSALSAKAFGALQNSPPNPCSIFQFPNLSVTATAMSF